MASKAHGTRRVMLVCVAVVALAAASAWGAEVPVVVSPGSDSELVRVEARCPTFSWGAVVGAQRYELVVYRVGDGGEEARAVLEQAIAGAALSWTPSLGVCLERGGRYAWSVRALGSGGEGEWSPPMWFEVATAGVGRDSGVAAGRAEEEVESAGGRQGGPVSTQAARGAAVGARSGARSEGRAAGEWRGGQGADAASASPKGSAGPVSKGHSIRSDMPSLALTQADTPSLRIHQTVGAFPDQEWGLVGNELAFEIRDVTGVTSPVVIEPGAPTHSLTVEAGGVVASGAGFRFPDGSLQTKAAGGAPAPVPESGQTTCWDAGGAVISCAGTGMDGDLRRGVQWPVPRFTDNGDGTVTDELTGVIWLRDASCADLAGTAADGSGTWTTALSAAAALASGTCGLTDGSSAGDWRLPQVVEFQSLIDYEFSLPALSNAAGTAKWTEGDAFSGVQSSGYWSSTSDALGPTAAWFVFLNSGFVGVNPKTLTSFVWPVRNGQ